MTAAADAGLPGAGSVFASLFLILALLAAVAFAAHWARARGWVTRPAGHGAINIVASRQIGWQSSFLIIEAEGSRFLVAQSRTGMTAIGRLDDGRELP